MQLCSGHARLGTLVITHNVVLCKAASSSQSGTSDGHEILLVIARGPALLVEVKGHQPQPAGRLVEPVHLVLEGTRQHPLAAVKVHQAHSHHILQ